MNVLVINCGSSSIKYKIFNMKDSSVLASGVLERIGESQSYLRHQCLNVSGEYEEISHTGQISDHREGLSWIIEVNLQSESACDASKLFGIGHRVVHGGEVFKAPALIDDKVMETIRNMIPLAPLHNPANLMGIEVTLERLPDISQVAVFDTAFHQTIPLYAYLYALPYDLYTRHYARRYGFHGTSHSYVAEEAAQYLGKPLDVLNLITLHLGNGASASAIQSGKSVDTSMGMTPLEGLIMGTRCGDIDPAMHFYLNRATGKSFEGLEFMLNKESGLKGICGVNDMREIVCRAESGDNRAQLAIEMFCYRIKKYIGAYCAVLGRVDSLIFTGGIGENANLIRKKSCEGLEGLGIIVDDKKNEVASGGIFEIQGEKGEIRILVIPTKEELEIARKTVQTIQQKTGTSNQH